MDNADIYIQHQCPYCDKRLFIPAKYAGRWGRCKGCGNPIEVPKLEKQQPNPIPTFNVKKIDPNIQVNKNTIDSGQVFGIIGSAILFIGVFMPIISVPVIGSLNYFQNGHGDGTIILVLAIVSMVCVLIKKYRALWFTGISIIGLLIFTFINLQLHLNEAKTSIETELADNPFRGFADAAIQSVQLQWGWALLILGAIFVITCAAIKDPLK